MAEKIDIVDTLREEAEELRGATPSEMHTADLLESAAHVILGMRRVTEAFASGRQAATELVETLRARIAELEQALLTYATHEEDCAKHHAATLPCSCGLREVMFPLEES